MELAAAVVATTLAKLSCYLSFSVTRRVHVLLPIWRPLSPQFIRLDSNCMPAAAPACWQLPGRPVTHHKATAAGLRSARRSGQTKKQYVFLTPLPHWFAIYTSPPLPPLYSPNKLAIPLLYAIGLMGGCGT